MNWTPISEKHPDPFKDVLVWDGIRHKVGYYDSDLKLVYYQATHWKELDKPEED